MRLHHTIGTKAIFIACATMAVISGTTTSFAATVPNSFTKGSTAIAADVNANFEELAKAITALETANAAHKSYYAEQSNFDGNGTTDDTWVDIPGVSIPVTFDTPTNFRYLVTGRVYDYGGTVPGVASCSVRIVTDDSGTPLNGSFPATLGEWNAILSAGATSTNNSQQLTLAGLKTAFPAGTYKFKLQIVRAATAGITNTGNCSMFRWNFSKARFFLDVIP